MWIPISLLLKLAYVLDIIMFPDGPQIQFFIAVATQFSGLVIFYKL